MATTSSGAGAVPGQKAADFSVGGSHCPEGWTLQRPGLRTFGARPPEGRPIRGRTWLRPGAGRPRCGSRPGRPSRSTSPSPSRPLPPIQRVGQPRSRRTPARPSGIDQSGSWSITGTAPTRAVTPTRPRTRRSVRDLLANITARPSPSRPCSKGSRTGPKRTSEGPSQHIAEGLHRGRDGAGSGAERRSPPAGHGRRGCHACPCGPARVETA